MQESINQSFLFLVKILIVFIVRAIADEAVGPVLDERLTIRALRGTQAGWPFLLTCPQLWCFFPIMPHTTIRIFENVFMHLHQ